MWRAGSSGQFSIVFDGAVLSPVRRVVVALPIADGLRGFGGVHARRKSPGRCFGKSPRPWAPLPADGREYRQRSARFHSLPH